MTTALVIGGAGFIGSHLCDALVARGTSTIAIDNLHLGHERNVAHLLAKPCFAFRRADILEAGRAGELVADYAPDVIYHLAANSDIQAGTRDPRLDLRLNLMTTLELLEAVCARPSTHLVFASTSAVFGETSALLHEDSGPLQPISFYGASKLAAEAYLSVYARTLGVRTTVVRFPNVVGERATHGILVDFLRKLRATPDQLDVLGNGRQSKPYLYVSDLIDAVLLAESTQHDVYDVFHAGGIGETSVREIAEIVVRAAGLPTTRIVYGESDRGWPGDVPRFAYDMRKLTNLGWAPRYRSTEAIALSVERILANGF
jgi:UDP-glucose 4-epimerase